MKLATGKIWITIIGLQENVWLLEFSVKTALHTNTFGEWPDLFESSSKP